MESSSKTDHYTAYKLERDEQTFIYALKAGEERAQTCSKAVAEVVGDQRERQTEQRVQKGKEQFKNQKTTCDFEIKKVIHSCDHNLSGTGQVTSKSIQSTYFVPIFFKLMFKFLTRQWVKQVKCAIKSNEHVSSNKMGTSIKQFPQIAARTEIRLLRMV